MLSIQECRKYLDGETSGALSDHEVMALRDALYGLAGLAVEAMRARVKHRIVTDANNEYDETTPPTF